MPHKHKRKRGDGDNAQHDLPPTVQAASLPVHKPRAVVADDDSTKRSNKRRKPSKPRAERPQKVTDDTPKQFARLMAFQKEGKKIRKGLDDGVSHPKTKKRKADESTTDTTPDIPPPASEPLKILPNERLADFSLRVDQTLPLSSVPKHGTKAPTTIPGIKEKTYLTKHNKRLARLQAGWREDEARLKEKRTEAEEELDEKREEEGLLWMDVDEARKGRKGKKSKAEGDIWRVLEKKRMDGGRGVKGGGLSAASSVQAPPELKRVKNLFKERRERGRGVVEVGVV